MRTSQTVSSPSMNWCRVTWFSSRSPVTALIVSVRLSFGSVHATGVLVGPAVIMETRTLVGSLMPGEYEDGRLDEMDKDDGAWRDGKR